MGASRCLLILHKGKKMPVVPKIDFVAYLMNRRPTILTVQREPHQAGEAGRPLCGSLVVRVTEGNKRGEGDNSRSKDSGRRVMRCSGRTGALVA